MTAEHDMVVGSAAATTNQARPGLGASGTESAHYYDGWGGDYHWPKAIDANDATYWSPGPTAGQWLRIDLGSAKRITAWRMLQEATHLATEFKIQSSDDDSIWVDQVAMVGGVADSGVAALFTPTLARYWRLLGITGPPGSGYNPWLVGAFELHTGTPAGTPSRLAIGAEGTVLTVVGGAQAWAAAAAGGTGGSAMTTTGDMLTVNVVPTVGANVALASLGATATAWSNYGGSLDIAYLIDGNGATRWSSSAFKYAGAWVQIDLGAPTLITAYQLLQYASSSYAAAAWVVQASTDGVAWADVQEGVRTTYDTGPIALTQLFTARYWRIATTVGGGSEWTMYAVNLFTGTAPQVGVRIPIGDEGQQMTVVAGLPTWSDPMPPGLLLYLTDTFR
jgi:hypothetical protein